MCLSCSPHSRWVTNPDCSFGEALPPPAFTQQSRGRTPSPTTLNVPVWKRERTLSTINTNYKPLHVRLGQVCHQMGFADLLILLALCGFQNCKTELRMRSGSHCLGAVAVRTPDLTPSWMKGRKRELI